MDLKKLQILTKIFLAILVLNALCILCVFGFLLVRKYHQEQYNDSVESGEFFHYQILEINPHSGESFFGFVTTKGFLDNNQFDSYEYESGFLTLISNVGDKEYLCGGVCYCVSDPFDTRRSSIPILKHSVYYLVAAVSTVFATEIAKQYFEEQKCVEIMSETCHSNQVIVSEVEKCEDTQFLQSEKIDDEEFELELKEKINKFWSDRHGEEDSITSLEELKGKKLLCQGRCIENEKNENKDELLNELSKRLCIQFEMTVEFDFDEFMEQNGMPTAEEEKKFLKGGQKANVIATQYFATQKLDPFCRAIKLGTLLDRGIEYYQKSVPSNTDGLEALEFLAGIDEWRNRDEVCSGYGNAKSVIPERLGELLALRISEDTHCREVIFSRYTAEAKSVQ